jgi:hypothetical protein
MIACQATLATDRPALNVLKNYCTKFSAEREADRPARASASVAAGGVPLIPARAGRPAGWMKFISI